MADSRAAIEEALVNLDPGWNVLADLQIGTPPDALSADYILLNGARGIALVDVAPGRPEDPVEPFRRFLDSEGFSGFFPGFLPIARLVVDPRNGAIGNRLDEAFGTVGALTITDPEWAEAVNTLLMAPAVEPEKQAPAPPLPPRQTERDHAWSAEAPHPGVTPRVAISPAAGGPQLIATPDDARWIRDLGERTSEERRPRRWLTAAVILIGLVGGAAAWVALMPAYQDEADKSSPSSVAVPLAAPPQSTASRSTSAPTTPSPRPDDASTRAEAAGTGAATAPLPPPVPVAKPGPEPSQIVEQAPPTPTPPQEASREAAVPIIAPPPASQAAQPAPPPAVSVAPPDPGPVAGGATEAPPTPLAKPAPPKAKAVAKPAIARAAPVAPPKPQATLVKPAPLPDRQPSELPATPPVVAQDREPSYAPPARTPSPPVAEGRSGRPPIDAADLPRIDDADVPPQTANALPPPPPARSETAGIAAIARSKPLSLLPRAEPQPPPAASGSTAEARVATPLAAPTGDGRVCRIYTATRTVQGQPQAVKGLACRLPDGRWQPVTEAPDR